MGDANPETVRSFYAKLNRGERDAALAMLAPEIVVDLSRLLNPDIKGVYRGREEVGAFFDRFIEAWADLEWFEQECIEVEGDVIRVGGMRARGRGSGVEVVAKGAQLWRFQGGVPQRMEMFQDKDSAVEAAGGS